MCGRFNLYELGKLFERYSITHPMFKLEPHANIAPGMTAPIVLKDGIVPMRWGLIPAWSKDPRQGFKPINARSETVMTNGLFRKPFLTQRCIVPANSFFEWKKLADGTKLPYSISVKNEEIFSLAGLYDVWHDAEGHELKTFTILTCQPNELMQPIHNRMPVILRRIDERLWLEPKLRQPDPVQAMLRPFPARLMQAVRISTLVNRPENDTPEILRPVPDGVRLAA